MAQQPKGKDLPQESSGSTRAIIFLGLSVVAGFAGVWVIYQGIQTYEQRLAEAKRPEEMTTALIAAGDLHPGLIITEADIRQVEIPKRLVHPEALNLPEYVVGATPRERILSNEFILPTRLADPTTGVGLNALVPSGMRAISLPISNAAALSGFLNPGNKVDVLVTITPDSGESQTHTLLQNIHVLAVNARMFEQADVAPEQRKGKRAPNKAQPSVTLSVTPEQALACYEATRRGEIVLTLRAENDDAEVATEGTSSKLILTEIQPPEVPKAPQPRSKAKIEVPPPPDQTLQIIRAGNKTEVKVGQDGALKKGN